MMSKRGLRAGLAVAVAGCALALPGVSAEASTITVGSVLPPGFSPAAFGQVQTVFNTTLPEKGANLTSPVNGAIVRWRVLGASGGPFFLRVLHPNGSGAYEATGTSAAASPVSNELQTFSTNVPIAKGDLIGIDPSNGSDEIGIAPTAAASYAFIFPPPFNGATVAPSGTESGSEIALSAEVQPAPQVSELENFKGSVAGGTEVRIKGENLTGAGLVKFGNRPATAVTLQSDTLITATSPRSSRAGFVDVTVTTAAGTSPAVRSDRFKYEACVVPKLKGKTVAAARKALKRAHCKLGRVGGRKGKKSSVKAQNPRPGKVKVPGTRVKVKVRPAKKKA